MLFPGPLVAVLIHLLGSRLVIISGGCMTSLGFILASQSSNVVQLAIFLAGLSGKSVSRLFNAMFLKIILTLPVWSQYHRAA